MSLSLSLLSTALIPYIPQKTVMEFLRAEFEKFQDKQLIDLIWIQACQIGSIEHGRATVWVKEDCTVEKIRTCSYIRLYQAGLDEASLQISKELGEIVKG
jgi:hypothetical protein